VKRPACTRFLILFLRRGNSRKGKWSNLFRPVLQEFKRCDDWPRRAAEATLTGIRRYSAINRAWVYQIFAINLHAVLQGATHGRILSADSIASCRDYGQFAAADACQQMGPRSRVEMVPVESVAGRISRGHGWCPTRSGIPGHAGERFASGQHGNYRFPAVAKQQTRTRSFSWLLKAISIGLRPHSYPGPAVPSSVSMSGRYSDKSDANLKRVLLHCIRLSISSFPAKAGIQADLLTHHCSNATRRSIRTFYNPTAWNPAFARMTFLR